MAIEVQRVEQQQPIVNQPAPAAAIPASKAIFTQFKEKVTWAWDASIQNLKTAGEKMKQLLQRIVEAVRTFFAPKLESAKQTLRNVADNLSLKLGARIYTPRLDALKTQNVGLENRLRQTTQEKDQALQANQVLAQELAQLRQAAEPQLAIQQPQQELPQQPVQVQQQLQQPLQEPALQQQPEQQPVPVQQPAQQLVPEQVGIFNVRRWF